MIYFIFFFLRKQYHIDWLAVVWAIWDVWVLGVRAMRGALVIIFLLYRRISK